MRSVIKTWQPLIQSEISSIIRDFSKTHAVFELDEAQLQYLETLSNSGKQFRGCVLAGFYSLLQPDTTNEEKKVIARLAAAVELHGTAILIHDDIIDKSATRRGMETAHYFATGTAKKTRLVDAQHFGVGAAICMADVLFFLADKTVAELDLPADLKIKLAAINAEELALLGLAEIEDMRLSSSNEQFSKDDILKMFAGKTGRYTGRWPLHLAAVMAQLPSKLSTTVAAVGEKIGVLYQLKDDELGIFGDESITGKSTTSDIIEGKKTFYYWHLLQLPIKERTKVFKVLGNPKATSKQLTWLKDFIQQQGIKEQVTEEMLFLKKEVVIEISDLDIAESSRQFLMDVVEFVVARDK